MSRDNVCVHRPHMHVGQCMRAGYASGRADALDELDDALCDAFMAAKHGSYDGRKVEAHLESLIERVRANG